MTKQTFKATSKGWLALRVVNRDNRLVESLRLRDCEAETDDRGRWVLTYREHRKQKPHTILVPSETTGASWAVITVGDDTVFDTRTANTRPTITEPEPEVLAPVVSLASTPPVHELDEEFEATDLTVLAERANYYHSVALGHIRNAVEYAAQAGRALQAAKDMLGHRNFGPWLEANFDGSHRTATRYMSIASNWSRVSNLMDPGASINSALRAIKITDPAPPREQPRDKPEKPGKLTPARRDYLVRELGRLREWLAYLLSDDAPVLDGMSVKDVEGWVAMLPDLIKTIDRNGG
jgi:hypothetical protein